MEYLEFNENPSAKEYKLDLKSRLEYAQERLKERYEDYIIDAREEQKKIREVLIKLDIFESHAKIHHDQNKINAKKYKILSKRHDDINYEIYIYEMYINQNINLNYNPNFTNSKYEDCYNFSQDIKKLYNELKIIVDDYNDNLYIYYYLYSNLNDYYEKITAN